ncbi:response regulator [Tranquillimonas alkanivorans]|uniref:Response regulator receiver domain-containing protein n=1 Tax=Tranquillimonas alkanivorans TaxID=441119 RepID=A0A1I5U9B3_9RHOB|nr:response regulator [Tranquillimonas alkanivorans]SFP91832.1 Response regulator receiver domain-containing protein [Tranquillimonas alkanivorans]
MSRLNIIIAEDEALIALDLRCMCEDAGHRVLSEARSAGEARQVFSALVPDLLLTDMDLAEGSDGVEVVRDLRRHAPDTCIVFVTATSDQSTLDRISAVQPDMVLAKPVTELDLERAFRLAQGAVAQSATHGALRHRQPHQGAK